MTLPVLEPSKKRLLEYPLRIKARHCKSYQLFAIAFRLLAAKIIRPAVFGKVPYRIDQQLTFGTKVARCHLGFDSSCLYFAT
jgi:hypothetical protein